MKLRLSIALLIIALVVPFSVTAESSKPVLTFGLVPQQSASRLAQLWSPIFKYIGKRSGVELIFATAPSIPEFEKRCAMGEYDIAYMNPYHYTAFHENPGYEAFAKQKDKRIKGIIVAKKGSAVKDLQDLKHEVLAFPAPAAFAASVLTRAKLARENIDFSAEYVRSHDSVYRSVAKGLYVVGGGIERTFKNVDPSIQSQLYVLWKSKGYTPHAFAAHPGVDKTIVKRIQQVMLNMSQDEEGKRLLKNINFKGIEAAKNKDWDDVRHLGIELLERLIQG